MIKQHPITSWFIQRTQCCAKNAICPLKIQSLISVVTCKWIWIVQIIWSAPRSSLCHVKNHQSIAPNIHDIDESSIAFTIADIDDNVRVERALQNLIGREWISDDLLIGGQVKSDNFRWTQLLEICESVDNAWIDDPQSITLVDCHAINRQKAITVGICGRCVSGPVGIRCESGRLSEGGKIDGW